MITSDRDGDLRGASFAGLFHRLTGEIGDLVRCEIALAKNELLESGTRLGKVAALGGVAALLGAGAFFALTACFVLALATQMTAWLAALVVALVYGGVAGACALVAKHHLAHVSLGETAQTLREDAAWAKAEIKSAAK